VSEQYFDECMLAMIEESEMQKEREAEEEAKNGGA